MFGIAATFLSSILVGIVVLSITCWTLKILHVGQNIRREGPRTHFKKAGTPTMGGIGIVLTVLIYFLILINFDINIEYAGLLVLFAGLAFLGFIDDLIKSLRRENQGLKAWQKIAGQVALSLVFSLFLYLAGFHLKAWYPLSLLRFYYPFVVLVILATANSVNLTDGLDGLAAGALAIAFFCFGVLAFFAARVDLALICAAACGANIAFLKFNFHPADVFMGDVGSLAMGGLLAGIAVLLGKEIFLIAIGGVFVIEALSVILQVFSFKVFGSRIFRMAPLHHHFELLGVPEIKIVAGFWFAAAIFGGLGLWLAAL